MHINERIADLASKLSSVFNYAYDFCFSRKYMFADEYDIVKMMITNCIDSDIKNPVPMQLLNKKPTSDYEAFVNLFLAIQLLQEIASEFEYDGFELEERWLQQLDSANDRLLDDTKYLLSKKDQNKFDTDMSKLCTLVSSAHHDSCYEVLFDYKYQEPKETDYTD